MTVFDENGHAELGDEDALWAALKELCATPKWDRGVVRAEKADGALKFGLEVNPAPGQPGLQGFTAFVGDYLVKLGPDALGFVIRMTASEHAAAYPEMH